MKLDKKTIFSIFIVLLFVGSMFAMVAYGGRDNAGNTPTDTIPTDTNQEAVNYQAQFDANVTEIFPQLIIAGKPIEFETTAIEAKLLDLQGIKKKTIEYRQAQDGNISLIITLNISTDKKQEIINGIRDFNIIAEPIEMYQYAMLEVPQDINFTNDQNQEIAYTFGAVPMEGIININTVKGDEITAVCYASFVGQELVSAKGIEMANLSSQPQMLVSTGEFNIIEYKEQISAETTYDFNEVQDDVQFENILKKDFSNFRITNEVTKPLIFNIKDLNEEEITNKLSKIKTDMQEQINKSNSSEDFNSDFDFEINGNTVSIYFDNNLKRGFHNYKLQAILFDLSYNLQNTEITQYPQITTRIEFDTNEIDVTKLTKDLNKTKEQITLKILANIDTSNLTIEGQTYTYENPTTETLLDYPEDINKSSIELNIQAYKQKEKILFLSLQK